jgi:hypothetical protein
MIRTMPSPEQESESLNSQFLVDSMPAMIHTARPDGCLDYFNKRWLECLGVIMYDVSQWKCRAFAHREVEGIVAKGRACLATGEEFGYETRVRDGRGNNFHVKDLVDRFRANDRTHAVTNCDLSRAVKFDLLWRDR